MGKRTVIQARYHMEEDCTAWAKDETISWQGQLLLVVPLLRHFFFLPCLKVDASLMSLFNICPNFLSPCPHQYPYLEWYWCRQVYQMSSGTCLDCYPHIQILNIIRFQLISLLAEIYENLELVLYKFHNTSALPFSVPLTQFYVQERTQLPLHPGCECVLGHAADLPI